MFENYFEEAALLCFSQFTDLYLHIIIILKVLPQLQ